MISQSKIDTRKAILRARGVPEKFIDNLATRKGGGTLRVFVLVALVIAVLIFMASFYALIVFADQIEAFLVPIIYREAVSSLLFYLPGAFFSLVPVTIITAFFLGLLIGMTAIVRFEKATKPSPAYSPYAESLFVLKASETLATLLPNPAYAKLAHLSDDIAFLKAVFPKNKLSVLGLLPIIFMLACMFFPLYRMISPQRPSLFDYKDVTLEAVRLRTSKGTVSYPLKEVKYAYVLCYDGPSHPDFTYRLVYPNKKIRLWETDDPLHKLGPEQVLERLNQIDAELTRQHVPIHRMPMTGSPYDDAVSCIDNAAKEWELKDTKLLRHLVFGE